MNMK